MKPFARVFLLVVLICSCHIAFAQTTETELLSAAEQAFNDGFSDVASRYLEEFLQNYPQSLKLDTAKLLLGQCDFLRGLYPQALDLFEELSQKPDKKDEVLFWRAETYLKQNRLREAQNDYNAVIHDFPDSSFVPQAYYSLGWSFFEEKRFTEAKAVFSRLTEQFPSNQFSEDAALKIAECDYNSGHLKEALSDFKLLADRFPKSSHLCEINFYSAESLYYLEQFDSAVSFYQKILDSSCEDALKLSAYMGEGWSYIKLKSFDESGDILKTAEEFCKTRGLSLQEVVLARANLAFERGFYANALTLFSDFIKSYPQNGHWVQGYLGRANVYYLLRRYDEALGDYRHLLNQTDPEIFQKVRFGMGWCELKMGHLQESVSHFQEVYDKSTQADIRVSALIQMADVYQESGDWSNAAQLYQKVEKDFSNNGMMDYVLYRQAIVFLKLGKIDASLRNFKDLETDFPDSQYLQDMDYYRGIISFKKNDWKQSALTMDRFLKKLTHPSEFTPEASYILALSRLNLKEPEEALKVFQKILRLYPNETKIAQNADIGIAKCQSQLGQYKEAVKRFKLVVYKYPKTDVALEALLWLAQFYLKNADVDAATDFYRSIIEEFPDSPQIDQIHYELGQAYEIQGLLEKALEEYKAISSKDEHLTAKTRLAIAGVLSKELDPHMAIAAYESIIKTSPEYAGEAYLKLGQLYRNAQNYEKEMDVYQRALSMTKGSVNRAQLQFNLADTLELMSRTEDAIAEYLKIPVLYTNEQVWAVKAYLRVAKIYEEGQDWQGSKVTYQKIIQLKTPEAAYAQERLDWIKNNAWKMRKL
ncbi:MAG: tetratricopeptide repeat protein [Candidatus Omnitrophica bacterium]|nr:tetratricopeptide repeat protein [Candidatus Omnitrophota bacterium]